MTEHNPNPSMLAMVPFVSVDNMMKIINTIGPGKMIAEIAEYVEDDFKRWENFDKTPRVASHSCLLYTSPSPRDATLSRMPSSA